MTMVTESDYSLVGTMSQQLIDPLISTDPSLKEGDIDIAKSIQLFFA